MNKNALSLPILIALVIGNMIGTGIYLLPATLAAFGSVSLLAWVFTSFGAIFLALTFGRLNKRYPKTGGPYVYCYEAYGHLVGFIIAYAYWLSNVISIAGISVATIGYLGFLTPYLNANTSLYQPKLVLLSELAIVWLLTWINLFGVHAAGIIQVILTFIKILPLIIISVFGISQMHLQNFVPFTAGDVTPLQGMTSAATLTFWAFIGLETATVPAENTKGPHDVYIATVFGVIATGLIYIISSTVIMGLIPEAKLSHSQFPFAEASVMLFGESTAIIIAICAFISGVGALNASTLVQGQVVFAAARDGLFPSIFKKLSKHDAPINGQLLSASIVTILLIATAGASLIKQFDIIITLAGVITLITYLLCALAEVKFTLLTNKKTLFISVIAALYSLWMLSSFHSKTLMTIFIVILICLPFYYFLIKQKK